MLISLFSVREGDNYQKVLRHRCLFFGFFIALGIAAIAVSILLGSRLPNFARGFYPGVGTGVAAAALMGLVSTLQLMKNKEKMRTEQIKETDERGKMVTLRAMSATALMLIVAAYVALMVSVALNPAVFFTLMGVILVFFVVFLTTHAYFDKTL